MSANVAMKAFNEENVDPFSRLAIRIFHKIIHTFIKYGDQALQIMVNNLQQKPTATAKFKIKRLQRSINQDSQD